MATLFVQLTEYPCICEPEAKTIEIHLSLLSPLAPVNWLYKYNHGLLLW